MAEKTVKEFQTTFAGDEQTVPATDNKGVVTITMPDSAHPGDRYPLDAYAHDMSDRTIARAEKIITAVEPGIERPVILSPQHNSYVLNEVFEIRMADYTPTPGYPGNHVSTTYEVTTEPDGQGEVLYQGTSTTDLLTASLTLNRRLEASENAFLRVKFTDGTLGDSEWSENHHILGTFALAPEVISPKKEAVVHYKKFTITTDKLTCAGYVEDVHAKTDWWITGVTNSTVYAESMGDTTNLTSITFENVPDMPMGAYLAVHIVHYGAQAGASKETVYVIHTSEKEEIVKPSVVFPIGYTHPHAFNLVISPLKVKNLDDPVLAASQLVISTDEAGDDVLLDTGEVAGTLQHSVVLDPALAPGTKMYFHVRVKEESLGWSKWSDPQECLAARTIPPGFLQPLNNSVVFHTAFTAEITKMSVQGLTSDTHVSTSWEVWDDKEENKLFSLYDSTTNLTSVDVTLPESMMGEYIVLKAKQTGEYTGESEWGSIRVLLHLPMTVFPPTVLTPTSDQYVHPTNFTVTLSQFETENVDNPNHVASQVKVCADPAGANVLMFSSEFENGDKRTYDVKLGQPAYLSFLYVAARMKDGFAGWSDWGPTKAIRVTYPEAPTIDKPVAGEEYGYSVIPVSLSGFRCKGGVQGVEVEGCHLKFVNSANGTVYLEGDFDEYENISISLPEEAGDTGVDMIAYFRGKGTVAGETSTVSFRTRLLAPGYRIDGKATVIGLPNGDPFDIHGRKVYIAVADSVFRKHTATGRYTCDSSYCWYTSAANACGDDAYGTYGIDTILPNFTNTQAASGNGDFNFFEGYGQSGNSNGKTLQNVILSQTIKDTTDSAYNTGILLGKYGDKDTAYAKHCHDCVIADLHFEMPTISVLGLVMASTQFLDERDDSVKEGSKKLALDHVQASSTEVDANEFAYIRRDFYKPANVTVNPDTYEVSTGSIAGETWAHSLRFSILAKQYATKLDSCMGVIPCLEIPAGTIVKGETEVSTPTIKGPDVIELNKGDEYELHATSNALFAPVKKFSVDINGQTSEVDAIGGYAFINVQATSVEDITITVIAYALDGTASEPAVKVVKVRKISVGIPSIIKPAEDSYILKNNITITTTAFSQPEGRRDTHVASRFVISRDIEMTDTIFDSGRITTGLTSYTVNLPTDLTPRDEVYIFASHFGATYGESEMSAPAHATVTYPAKLNVTKPTDQKKVIPSSIPLRWDATSLLGNEEGLLIGESLLKATLHVDVCDASGTMVLESVTKEFKDGMKQTRVASETAPRDTFCQLKIWREVEGYGAGDPAIVTVYMMNSKIGERYEDIGTLLGNADGTPFTIRGRKVWICVLDNKYWSNIGNFWAEALVLTGNTKVESRWFGLGHYAYAMDEAYTSFGVLEKNDWTITYDSTEAEVEDYGLSGDYEQALDTELMKKGGHDCYTPGHVLSQRLSKIANGYTSLASPHNAPPPFKKQTHWDEDKVTFTGNVSTTGAPAIDRCLKVGANGEQAGLPTTDELARLLANNAFYDDMLGINLIEYAAKVMGPSFLWDEPDYTFGTFATCDMNYTDAQQTYAFKRPAGSTVGWPLIQSSNREINVLRQGTYTALSIRYYYPVKRKISSIIYKEDLPRTRNFSGLGTFPTSGQLKESAAMPIIIVPYDDANKESLEVGRKNDLYLGNGTVEFNSGTNTYSMKLSNGDEKHVLSMKEYFERNPSAVNEASDKGAYFRIRVNEPDNGTGANKISTLYYKDKTLWYIHPDVMNNYETYFADSFMNSPAENSKFIIRNGAGLSGPYVKGQMFWQPSGDPAKDCLQTQNMWSTVLSHLYCKFTIPNESQQNIIRMDVRLGGYTDTTMMATNDPLRFYVLRRNEYYAQEYYSYWEAITLTDVYNKETRTVHSATKFGAPTKSGIGQNTGSATWNAAEAYYAEVKSMLTGGMWASPDIMGVAIPHLSYGLTFNAYSISHGVTNWTQVDKDLPYITHLGFRYDPDDPLGTEMDKTKWKF